jgi:glutaredoxin
VLFLAVMASSLDAVRLYRMDLPDHACPWGLRALQLLQERYIPFEDHCLTSTEEVEAFKLAHGVASTPQVFSGDERVGGYSDLAARLGDRAESADISYAPMAAGVGGFKGFAIYLLAMLKLMDVEAFAASFRKYDLLSQRWRLWGEGSTPGSSCWWASGCFGNRRPSPLPSGWAPWLFGSVPWAWCRRARLCSSIT